MQLAIRGLWMGGLVAITSGAGGFFVLMSQARGGALDAPFTALCGLLLLGVTARLLWQLWFAVEPTPITDDFLQLLNDSFGSDWRNPLTWPWARCLYAYGFAAAGALVTALVALFLWTAIAATPLPNVHRPRASGHRLPAIGYRLPATGPRATGHRLPATTDHRPPSTD